ncbi:hypothetical protein QT979_17470 [Microcoleus sp. w2-18bC1]|uniref:hypothetical protein n=1 Tax=unclassified Microcoleus TaxID=2642155 RepID=UPI002FD65B3C
MSRSATRPLQNAQKQANGRSVAHPAKISEKWEVKGDRRSASGERSIMSVPSVWWFESLPNAVE